MPRPLRRPLIVIALAVGFAFWAAAAAQAGVQILVCGQRGNIIAQLAGRYGETRQGGALPQSKMPVEIYANRRTGTWTLLQSHMRGRVCVVNDGTGWPDVTPVVGTGA